MPTPATTPFFRLLTAVVLILLASADPAIGQSGTGAGGSSASAPVVDPALNPSAFEVATMGVRLNLPKGAEVTAERIDGVLSFYITDVAKASEWSMRLQTMESSLAQPSAKGQIEEHLKLLNNARKPYEVMHQGPARYGGADGWQCFIVQPTQDGKQAFVNGWVILPSSERSFVVFSVIALPEVIDALRALLDKSFNTLVLTPAEKVVAEREAGLAAGADVLARITPEQLKALIGLKQWTRVYQPARADRPALELAYSLLEVRDGTRKELGESGRSSKFDLSERGLIVQVQARMAVHDDKGQPRGVYFDTLAQYWLSWDCSEEAWSVIVTQRQGEAQFSESETGIRAAPVSGSPRQLLAVFKANNSGTNMNEPFEWDVPEVYLSQALGWVLGRLLPRDIDSPQTYLWYAYNNVTSQQPQMLMRQDVWRPTPNGQWELESRLSAESPTYVAVYDDKGNLIKRTHADGSITEPSTPETIRKVWRSAGLDPGGKP